MAWLPHGLYPTLDLIFIVIGLAFVLRPGFPKAYGFGLVMLGAFLIDTISQVTGKGPTQPELGFVAARFFAGDGWWTPLTSIFTHAAPGGGRSFFNIHLIGNLFILVAAGPALEARIGERKFTLIFFTAALAALVAHVLLAYFTPITSPDLIVLGASGAIFGVLTAFAVRYPKEKLPLIFLFIIYLPAFIVLLVYLGLNIVLMLSGSNGVAWWGHFAGFLVGLPFAYMLPKTAPDAAPKQGSVRGLPDPQKLSPLATTHELKEILARVSQFSPDARTAHDAQFADAWLDKFFQKAECANGHRFHARKGMSATCVAGETTVQFERT